LAGRPTELPLFFVFVLITLVGCGLGPVFPTTIVAIQNAVPLHQLGISTGLISFSRSLGGSLIVTLFSAVVLAGMPDGGIGAVDRLAVMGHGGGLDANVFRWVFAAAAMCLVAAFGCVLAMDERPLRSSTSGFVE
jgi:hypothetical protein